MVLPGTEYHPGIDFARKLDRENPLREYRRQFYYPSDRIYLDGNSLGLMSRPAEESLHRVSLEWKRLAIAGWLHAAEPWFYFAEKIGAMASLLVGAREKEVIAAGTTTVNIHTLLNGFYKPQGKRMKILSDESNFPSDIYALKSHLGSRGMDSREHLLLAKTECEGSLGEDSLIALMDTDCALVFLSSVQFRNGQLFNMKRLTQEAHKRNILIGFDCSHSAGVVPHKLHDWGVDFATWCGYKYLNGGPGSTAFMYIHEKHFARKPGMAGWFGYRKNRQFNMDLHFEPEESAGGWQISTPTLFSLAPLEGSLRLMQEAGLEKIRNRSLILTGYLMYLIREELSAPPYNFYSITPVDPELRGGHVALCRKDDSWRICEALKGRGYIADYRPPNIIRIAPVALYNTAEEIWSLVQTLKEIIDTEEFEQYGHEIKTVS